VLKLAKKPEGFYKGQPTSPNTVKFTTEFQGIPIHIDRPRGFIMKGTDSAGRDWARRYKYDYGFIPKTLGGDGDGLDVFIGPKKRAPTAFWAVQRKEDGTFDEYKVFLGFDNRDEAIAAYRQHIPKKLFKGILTMRIEMMKSMLGKVTPNEKFKRASMLAEYVSLVGTTKVAGVGWDLHGYHTDPKDNPSGQSDEAMGDAWDRTKNSRIHTPYDKLTNYKSNDYLALSHANDLWDNTTDFAYGQKPTENRLTRDQLKNVVTRYQKAHRDFQAKVPNETGTGYYRPVVKKAIGKDATAFVRKANHLLKDPDFKFARLEYE